MELKFRAWHKEKNIMSDEFSFYDFDVEYFIPNGWSFHHMIIMQYTGLKDKNGKEIFEGDIIRCEIHSHEQYQEFLSSNPITVSFSDGCFYPFGYKSGWRSSVEDIEIIGNIYENPELLGGVK